MRLCRFQNAQQQIRVALIDDVLGAFDLTAAGIETMQPLLETDELLSHLAKMAKENLPRVSLSDMRLLAPVERQEIWAAGVTYLRSKKARMDESKHSASAYDLVYDAERPELFFKSLPEKVVGPHEPVGIRRDSKWNVPEPELALVINSRGRVVGYTIGNDMSSRDIEGANLLYLPQAKVYERSCALGPFIVLDASEAEARRWTIALEIQRQGQGVFQGETCVAQIKRSFRELSEFLCRSQSFPNGAILLTGTGIVPPDHFTLQAGDTIKIEISGIGILENPVCEV